MIGPAFLALAVSAMMQQSADVARVDQISAAAPVVPMATPRPTGDAPEQLTPVASSKTPAGQVGTSSRSANPPQQLAPRQRSAQAAASLSKPADSRPTAAERLQGADRCDPQQAGERSKRCRRIIENRAAEYNRNEAPVLSPEQKISLEQAGIDRTGIDAATRQLATTGDAMGSIDAQGVAAIVLSAPAETRKPQPELDPDQAEAAAAVSGLINQPPQ